MPSLRTTAGLAGGDFLPDGLCAYGAYACDITNQPGVFGDTGYHYAVQYDYASAALGISYVRSGGPTVQIPCNSSLFSSSATWQYAYGFMQNAYAHGLIPIVTIEQNDACPYNPANPTLNTDWAYAMEWFAYLMPSMNSAAFGPNPPMYFEIGNEENDTNANPAQIWSGFPSWFALAAQGLQLFLTSSGSYHSAYSNYYVLTGGVAGPTPYAGCLNPPSHYAYNVGPLQQALSKAQAYENDPDPSNPIYLPGVAAAHLAVASHPYGYDTPPPYASNLWPNYWSVGGGYPGDCEDLNGLIGNWNSYYFSGYRHVATEDNYNSLPNNTQQVMTNFEGACLLDLFTWLYNNLGADGQWGYPGGEAAYPFNVLWYEGYDTPNSGNGHVGLLQRSQVGNSWIGFDKIISFTTSCTGNPAIGITSNRTLTYLMAQMDLVGNTNPYTPGNHCS